jgi:putative ABC transport system permease protein
VKYLPLVWSAIARKPAEAILICLAVTAAFTLFGTMLGLRATYNSLIDNARNDRLDTDPRFPLSNGLRLPIAMRNQIARIDGVTAVASNSLLRGYYQDPHNTGRITMVDEVMRDVGYDFKLTPAQWDYLFATPTGVYLSRKAAQRWNLREGDPLPLSALPGTRADGATYWRFQVLGVVPDKPTSLNGFILGNYKYYDNSRPLQDQGTTMEFRIAIKDASRADEISLAIDRLLANSGTPTLTIPEKSNAQLALTSGISAGSASWPVAGAGLFMILMLVANGIAQSVRERHAEFAVLRTLGFQHRTLGSLVFLEAAIPCLIGGILGTLLAAILSQVPIRYLPENLAHLPAPTILPAVVATAMVFVMLLALASSVIPILRLRRLSVIDALAAG